MDLVAVWLNCGEGLNGNILQEESDAHLSRSNTTMALTPQGTYAKAKRSEESTIISFTPKYVFLFKHSEPI